jgi:hypothetical protein
VGEDAPVKTVAVIAVAALALLAAGCGGNGSPHVASGTHTAATTGQNAMLSYSHCMRAHGLPHFPDPQQMGTNPKLVIRRLIGDDPHFPVAARACESLLPNVRSGRQETPQQMHARVAAELSFARCMRGHGLSRFPDPNGQGELSVEMVQAQGIDVHSTPVLHVVQACLPASHGWLTPAKVREAINGH